MNDRGPETDESVARIIQANHRSFLKSSKDFFVRLFAKKALYGGGSPGRVITAPSENEANDRRAIEGLLRAHNWDGLALYTGLSKDQVSR